MNTSVCCGRELCPAKPQVPLLLLWCLSPVQWKESMAEAAVMPAAGRAAGRYPAGFAQVAAALKARRAELAARQKPLAAEQPVPPMAGIESAKSPSASAHAPAASTSSQPQPPDDHVQAAAAVKQATAVVAETHGSRAAGQLDADVAEAVPSNSYTLGSSADLGPHPQSAGGAMQLQDSSAGVPKQSHGVKTRSAARQQEHATIPTAPESTRGSRPSHQPGSATELAQQVTPFSACHCIPPTSLDVQSVL